MPKIPRRKTNKQKLIAEAAKGGIMPLDYILKQMRDKNTSAEVRMDAAKAAAPYLHSRMASITVSGSLKIDVSKLPDEALALLDRLHKLVGANVARGGAG